MLDTLPRTRCPRCDRLLVAEYDLDLRRRVGHCYACGYDDFERATDVLIADPVPAVPEERPVAGVKLCEFCGKPFQFGGRGRKLSQRFCSMACVYQGRKSRPRSRQ